MNSLRKGTPAVEARLPDVLGIGFRRCATSWLQRVLGDHPQIGKPEGGVHFFSEHADRGLEWYASQFETHRDRPVLLDFSVSYTYPEYCGAVAERMRRWTPSAKLLAAVRNPVDRAFSDYLRSIRLSELPAGTSFEEAIEQSPVLLERGLYGRLLGEYYARFPAHQILVLVYDDLSRQPDEYLQQIFRFIAVDPRLDQLDLGRKEPVGGKPRSPTLTRLIRTATQTADRTMHRIGLGESWRRFKARHSKTYQSLLAANTRPSTVKPATLRKLHDYYRDDITLLERTISKDLSPWLTGAGGPS